MPKRMPIPRDDQFSEGDVRNILCNPFHVYTKTITADEWVKAIVRLAGEDGLENTLRRIASVYDESAGGNGKIEDVLGDQLIQQFAEHSGKVPLKELFRQTLDCLDPSRD
jgi:hypothetical protein